jgi:hypothetical protein
MAKRKIFKHLHTINKHRFIVFKNCCKLGIPFRGLFHDLSKYSSKEFWPSTKYYRGVGSPILNERKETTYSNIWNHHTNRNKHHFEYWIDLCNNFIFIRPMPYKYALEYVADVISASKTYNGKNFTPGMPLNYFSARKHTYLMHSTTKEFVETLFKEYSQNGFKNLKKKNTKKIYENCFSKQPKTEVYNLLNENNELEISIDVPNFIKNK